MYSLCIFSVSGSENQDTSDFWSNQSEYIGLANKGVIWPTALKKDGQQRVTHSSKMMKDWLVIISHYKVVGQIPQTFLLTKYPRVLVAFLCSHCSFYSAIFLHQFCAFNKNVLYFQKCHIHACVSVHVSVKDKCVSKKAQFLFSCFLSLSVTLFLSLTPNRHTADGWWAVK